MVLKKSDVADNDKGQEHTSSIKQPPLCQRAISTETEDPGRKLSHERDNDEVLNVCFNMRTHAQMHGNVQI